MSSTVFLLDECQVEEVIKRRYKVSPTRIEPWFDDVIINANAVSTQSLTYTWRYSGEPDLNPASASKEFPFYIGWLRMNLYNGDPIQASVANAFCEISGYNLDSIATFYNTTPERLIRFGVGTFNGVNFPPPGDNVNVGNNNNPHFVSGPFITTQVFTDATGAVFLQVGLAFQGYRIFIS